MVERSSSATSVYRTTAGRPLARFTASRRSSTVSTRGWRISSKTWSGNCASSACISRAAVWPVASEMTWSSTGVVATGGAYRRRTRPFQSGPRDCPSAMAEPAIAANLARDLRKIAEPPDLVADLTEQREAVGADGAVFCHDEHFVEEPL